MLIISSIIFKKYNRYSQFIDKYCLIRYKENMNIKDIIKYIPDYIDQIDINEDKLKGITKYNIPQSYTFLMSSIIPLFNEMHFHDDFYEMLYVVEGECKYVLEDKIYHLKKGDLAFTFPNSMHQIVSNQNSKRFVCAFTNKYLKKYSSDTTNFFHIFDLMKQTSNFVISFSNKEINKVETLFYRMNQCMLSDKFGSDLQYSLSFLRIMLLLSENILNNKDINDVKYISNPIIQNVMNYVNNNFTKKITIDDIASEVALSPSYLSHFFKNNTGLSLLQFIIKKRLSFAKELLREGKSILDTSIECGFKDYSSFFRSFKKEFLITPKDYIKSSSLSYID